jgi:hypothetical protein
MNLFVDSNIFLDFYHFSEDDLAELRKLSQFIKDKKIRLFVTQQVKDEIKRNRDIKISDALSKFHESRMDIKFPQIYRVYPQYEIIRKSLIELKRQIAELENNLKKDITGKTLKADEIIKELLDLGEHIQCNDLLETAKNRYHVGNPPGKDRSYGDAINWEALLRIVPNAEDLFFVSDDKDYKSPITNGLFNSFLLDEWAEKKKSKLFYYTRLSELFNTYYKDIKLKDEEEKDRLIEQLSQSENFTNTHILIGNLSKYDGFSNSQIKRLIEVALSNSQVNWIATDKDVNEFFKKIISGKDAILDDIQLGQFKHYFYPEEFDKKASEDDFF